MPTPSTLAPSRVLGVPAADPNVARAHFAAKLALETDPSDVYADGKSGERGFVVVDARSPQSFAAGHVPGALNLHHRLIDAATTATLPKDKVIVTYCTGPACNASTHAAAKLSALGFRVKEMIGGLEGWKDEGYPLETGTAQ